MKIKIKKEESEEGEVGKDDRNVDAKIERLIEDHHTLKEEVEELKMEMESMKNKMNLGTLVKPLLSLKGEILEVKKEDILDALSLNSINGDMQIIRAYYMNVVDIPIKRFNLRHFEYWDDEWIVDPYGKTIQTIIANNLYRTYLLNNNLDNVSSGKFIDNQSYILKMQKDQYKKILLAEIVKKLSQK